MPYSQITNPSVTAYDAATGAFLGEARFTLTQQAERALLDWANFRMPIPSFVVVDTVFVPSDQYVPIIPNKIYHQEGIFRALFTRTDTGQKVPIEMRGTYDWRSRSVDLGNNIESAEFSNIKMNPFQETVY